MPYKETEIEKTYYSIGEVAKKFKVATSLIRFWEGEFDIIKPKKNRKGNRQFTKKDIENIQLIYVLVKEKGYTLSGAKEILRKNKQKDLSNTDMITSLQNVKDFLIDLKQQLP